MEIKEFSEEYKEIKEGNAVKRSLWDELKEPESVALYYPNRFEYFLGKILQGMVTGRAEKDLRSVVRQSFALAVKIENIIQEREEEEEI